jgi:hypothetical protein
VEFFLHNHFLKGPQKIGKKKIYASAIPQVNTPGAGHSQNKGLIISPWVGAYLGNVMLLLS